MNTSFSERLPTLQIYIDSTSLGEFKTCPRRYFYNIICGYQPHYESVHLTFGLLLHSAVEMYWTLRIVRQLPHQEALLLVIRAAMILTWDKKLNRPWQSDSKIKNRFTLVRTIVWYLDKFQEDPIQTVVLSNGKPAIELSFTFDSGYTAVTDEVISLCGRIDRLGTLHGDNHIVDIKSTGRPLSEKWFLDFNPHNQFTIYCIAGEKAFGVQTGGIIVDGCQVVQTFSDFQRQLITRTPYQISEWWDDLSYHLSNMEDCSLKNRWPMNDSACNLYGGCPYREVCSQRSEESKEIILRTQFKKRVWDPLQQRGDI